MMGPMGYPMMGMNMNMMGSGMMGDPSMMGMGQMGQVSYIFIRNEKCYVYCQISRTFF
jgi:hypothetical protein